MNCAGKRPHGEASLRVCCGRKESDKELRVSTKTRGHFGTQAQDRQQNTVHSNPQLPPHPLYSEMMFEIPTLARATDPWQIQEIIVASAEASTHVRAERLLKPKKDRSRLACQWPWLCTITFLHTNNHGTVWVRASDSKLRRQERL